MTAADPQSIRRAVDAVWKIESPRLIAGLVRIVRDVGLAEDLAQDALVAALETWPETGIPDKPGAWLMTAAKRRAVDHWRHLKLVDRKHEEIEHEQEDEEAALPDFERQIETALFQEAGDDDLLRLIFIACHPVLSTEARIALTLRLLGGLTTDEIARAYLVPEPTIAQRIVRAKRTLAQKRVPFETPDEATLAERLDSVLEVLYLIFNEGYSATAGEDWIRPALCQDALRLGRVLANLMPKESEVHGLVALMEFQASRLAARTGPDGEIVLLLDQDRRKWDRLMIRLGLESLERARAAAAAQGPYLLQAEIAACHAEAASAEEINWPRIVMLYELLGRIRPSPIVELNRAVAVCMAFGPETALPLVEALAEEPALTSYHLLPSVRGDFLFRLGRYAEARSAFDQAASLAANARERSFLLGRSRDCENRERGAVG
ncbi:MAG TPA: RNA polymerase sigma factor [Gammaproteobacteria bacterium]|nr:RNA polymerase sigma factor [Gammaproteobacteria bacterium]